MFSLQLLEIGSMFVLLSTLPLSVIIFSILAMSVSAPVGQFSTSCNSSGDAIPIARTCRKWYVRNCRSAARVNETRRRAGIVLAGLRSTSSSRTVSRLSNKRLWRKRRDYYNTRFTIYNTYGMFKMSKNDSFYDLRGSCVYFSQSGEKKGK